jgi:hypothetical protein
LIIIPIERHERENLGPFADTTPDTKRAANERDSLLHSKKPESDTAIILNERKLAIEPAA